MSDADALRYIRQGIGMRQRRHSRGKIRVCEGGILEINGGILQDADLELIPGCQVIIKNNGKINMANGKSFDVPVGAFVDIPYGSVN